MRKEALHLNTLIKMETLHASSLAHLWLATEFAISTKMTKMKNASASKVYTPKDKIFFC